MSAAIEAVDRVLIQEGSVEEPFLAGAELLEVVTEVSRRVISCAAPSAGCLAKDLGGSPKPRVIQQTAGGVAILVVIV
jgi:hypothetical protein